MKTIKVSLSVGGLQDAIRELAEYATSLDAKTQRFVDLLQDVGITAAELVLTIGTHTMPERITFEKTIETDGAYTLGVIIGTGETFPSVWIDALGNEHNADVVFPLAMMEFGSGAYALPKQDAFGGSGGQGSFAVMGNEVKTEWYVTRVDNGVKRRVKATAIRPTRPMYNAMLQMRSQIMECARKAFG